MSPIDDELVHRPLPRTWQKGLKQFGVIVGGILVASACLIGGLFWLGKSLNMTPTLEQIEQAATKIGKDTAPDPTKRYYAMAKQYRELATKYATASPAERKEIAANLLTLKGKLMTLVNSHPQSALPPEADRFRLPPKSE